MKILCVANWRSDVGYAWWLMERFWEAIARTYPGRVTISYPRLADVPQRLVTSGASFVEHVFNPESKETLDFIRQHGFEHLYLTDQAYYSFSYFRLRRAGVRRIIVHDHTPGERSPVRGLKRLVKSTLTKSDRLTADAYIAVSDLVLRRFVDCACLPREKCYLARNGIDMDVEISPANIRQELGLPKDALIVVSSSRATRYKGIQYIIEAAKDIDAHFLHCGDGPDLEEFQALIRKLNLQERFVLLERRTDVPQILAAADIAVHASAGEGLSLSVLEFMRAGLPIVLPDTPTVAQSINNEVTGLLYPACNVGALREQIQRLVADGDLRRRLGQAGKMDVHQYDIRETVSSVLGVFSRLNV